MDAGEDQEEELVACLYLSTRRGFQRGGQDQFYNRPTQWVQRSKSHVVVILNRRLNFFGSQMPQASGKRSKTSA
ncbi:hypothetical protein DL765_003395 [Monosporascus sp. GIB2]|nr:hypothetical protein DL765_003395 [Monosporascus sp. GIB2]